MTIPPIYDPPPPGDPVLLPDQASPDPAECLVRTLGGYWGLLCGHEPAITGGTTDELAARRYCYWVGAASALELILRGEDARRLADEARRWHCLWGAVADTPIPTTDELIARLARALE